MPVVTVTAPPPADATLLSAVADAVAAALGLGAGDVIATLVPAGATVLSGGGGASADPWPVVTIHGSPRPDERMRAARTDAEAAVRAWAAAAGAPLGGVWTEWVAP